TKEKAVLENAVGLVGSWKKRLVIDADCIGAVSKRGAVYTPHTVEFKRLSGSMPHKRVGKRCGQVRAIAKKLGSTVLLKGRVDVISDGKQVALNRTGNAGMTCGGSGDTLAGIVGAMLAAGHSGFESACLGAYLNGLAGDRAYNELGNSLMASDIVEKLPNALRSL
ncbi:MAG: NAD(P)H-hydrate dehydratase, partial [Candidatus Aenigmarchaeota archaeon]|nr:NAD(P)H-hydrate dehydratase [Candidatus Aenigmarchaeota archaeon]